MKNTMTTLAMRKVPFNDLRRHHATHARAFHEALDQLLETSAFVGGRGVQEFEKEFAAFCGVERAVGVGNGTDALFAALKAVGVQRGDLVVTVANTFIATVEAIVHAGASPVFCDIREIDYNMDPDSLEEVLSQGKNRDKIRCVVPVHLYGQPADMQAIEKICKKYAVPIVADAAQAHGANIQDKPHAQYGECSCYSFYPGKNLGALGDGGAVVTRSNALADDILKFCNHGRRDKYIHDKVGINSRLDTLQAFFLRRKLSVLGEKNRRRQELARWYDTRLADLPLVRPTIHADRLSVFHLYVIQVEDRDKVAADLRERGVETGVHYPLPLHLQPAFEYLGIHEGHLPLTERTSQRLLSLPLYPEMEDWEVPYVVEMLKEVLRGRGA